MKNKKGFFFSLITVMVIIMLFFYFKSSQEARKHEMELESERYTLLQYNDFQKDLRTNYVPTQMRLLTKMALMNISNNGAIDMVNVSTNLTQALLEGKIDSKPVLGEGLTFHSSIGRIHDNWLYSHRYNYTFHGIRARQVDWQNISVNYSVAFAMNASGYQYTLDMNGSVIITSYGLNTSIGLITPYWVMNSTEPCALKRMSSGYDCGGIPGSAPYQ